MSEKRTKKRNTNIYLLLKSKQEERAQVFNNLRCAYYSNRSFTKGSFRMLRPGVKIVVTQVIFTFRFNALKINVA